MNNIASVSQGELTQRRLMLRRHRRLKQVKTVWRNLAISGLLGGLFWGMNQPIWVVRESEQINISGNNLLSKQAIESFLNISYPQNLLEIKPEALAQALESQPTIADASVKRKLFPPSLTVQVTERVPVAIALTNKSAAPGFISADGVWIPQQSYALTNNTSFKMPKLRVIGQIEQYQPHWNQLYQAVSHLQIKVSEIDWQNPDNLILKTELGAVHLGTYSSKLVAQLQALEGMQDLHTKVKLQEIDYIDLTNSLNASVRMNSVTSPTVKENLAKKTNSRPQ